MSLLTAELTENIVDRVRRGIAPEVAAVAAGVSQSTYYNWRKRGQDGEEPYAGFWNAVARACAESEVALVERVQEGDGQGVGFGSSKAALEILQRRFPKRWSVQVKVEMSEQLNRFLDAAQRICSDEDFRKLLEALAEESGETAA